MRLEILDSGHGRGTKIMFALIGAASRQPVPEILKLTKYRRDFFGAEIQQLTHKVMRGPSVWSVADRELMAAFVANANASEYCAKAHSAVAARASYGAEKVAAVLSDLDAAPIGEPLRATLRMLRKLARDGSVSEADMRAVLSAGASREQMTDALAVSFVFNTIGRLADTFGFAIPGADALAAGAKFLLARGYK
jgi:AhpD family alkylhydroperoxidase